MGQAAPGQSQLSWVIHIHQIEATRLGGCPGQIALPRGQCLDYPLYRFEPLAADAEVRHIEPRRLGLAADGPERAEILLTQETLPGLMHQLCINRLVIMADAAAENDQPVVVVVDDITVATGGGAEAGVETLVHLCDSAHGDMRRQVGI